jgi:hypothetical protein
MSCSKHMPPSTPMNISGCTGLTLFAHVMQHSSTHPVMQPLCPRAGSVAVSVASACRLLCCPPFSIAAGTVGGVTAGTVGGVMSMSMSMSSESKVWMDGNGQWTRRPSSLKPHHPSRNELPIS